MTKSTSIHLNRAKVSCTSVTSESTVTVRSQALDSEMPVAVKVCELQQKRRLLQYLSNCKLSLIITHLLPLLNGFLPHWMVVAAGYP